MAEALNTVKRKRAFRRGRLTILKGQLDEQSEADLRFVNIDNLEKLKRSIEREIALHQALQDEYEQLLSEADVEHPDEAAFSAELQDGNDHQETYAEYLHTIEIIISEYELFKEADRLETSYTHWTESADPAARTFLDDSKDYLKRFELYLAKSERRSSSDIIAISRTNIRTLIGKVHRQVHDVKNAELLKPVSATTITPDRQTKFDIELPQFNGDPTEWAQFHSLFTTTIEKRGKHLTTEERCCLLIKSLKDPQAKKLAQLNTDDPDGYNEAISALVERYGQVHVLLPLHISKLKSARTFSFSREGMLQVGELFIQTHKSLETMKVDLSTFLAAYAASHFDAKLAEEWTRHTATMTSLPTCRDLNKYLQSRISRMPIETLPASTSFRSSYNKPGPAKVKTESTPKQTTCPICNNGVHSPARCPTFRDYTPDKRGKIVREKRWCLNCLHHSHQSQHCPSTYNCRHCDARHHSLLHKGDTTTQSAISTTSTANQPKPALVNISDKSTIANTSSENQPPPHAFLNTALTYVANGGLYRISRVALDSGSSSSLITESLASQLRLKRYSQHLSLVGAYSEGTSKHYVEATLRSLHNPEEEHTLKLSVVSKLPQATPPLKVDDIISHKHLKGLPLADKKLGGSFDILLGSMDVIRCTKGEHKYFPEADFAATPTLFGWTITGLLNQGQSSKFLSIQTRPDDLNEALRRMWESEQVPSQSLHSSADNSALEQFERTHTRDDTGRYSVCLPRVNSPPELGLSKPAAISRFFQNERSLEKKKKLDEFNQSLAEYISLDHAEPVPTAELSKDSYYLPVHGVFKLTSTTTKLRPVFDASAKTSNGNSLNDLLLAGPNLYPLLTDILIRFRLHPIGFAADISKMFREILIHPEERDLHRFLIRNSDGTVKDHRMKRLTFGVKSSPFLATKVLHDLAEKSSTTHPAASRAILNQFYVDDFLSGAKTVEEAKYIREQLCELLASAGMTLRKWRSSSQEFTNTIPESLQEKDNLSITDAPKALGIHWDVHQDKLSVSTPEITAAKTITKRIVASQQAKVYDLLGLFSPFIIRSKILLQRIWKAGTDWDEEVSPEIAALWNTWLSELPIIHNHSISRRYVLNDSDVVERSLHGFSDASAIAYGAVVYLRQVHQDGTIKVAMVISKARVAPLKTLTIPRAELSAAYLLTKLLLYSAKLLDIPQSQLHTWTDSTIVLCWIRKPPSSLQVFVANRVAYIQTSLPDVSWKHVPTLDNPADLLSRGTSATTLIQSTLWWEGPPWLSLHPTLWTSQERLCGVLPTRPPELKAVTLTAISQQEFPLWSRFSSFIKLSRILSWIRRFLKNCKLPVERRILSTHLLTSETKSSKLSILLRSQQETFPDVFTAIKKDKPLPSSHPLAKLNLHLDEEGLVTVSGRVRQLDHKLPKKLVALSIKSNLTKLFVSTLHTVYSHPGISALLAIITQDYYLPGLKKYLKKLSHDCATCQRAYARTLQPAMGLLPPQRTTPSPPFTITGLDFAGPFTIKKGHTRKPVYIKSYTCLFVCFSTKATHIELCSDLTSDAFLAALKRFCARRGTPSEVHCDNGSNFVGAASDLRQVQHVIHSSKEGISHLCSTTDITWHFIPPRAPNFGGLWEAGVRQMKLLLKKQVAPHPLEFDELSTVLTDVESILNSRPIIPLDSTEVDSDLVLTPGHFLIGRPLKTPARPVISSKKISSLKRWNLVLRLQQDLWLTWSGWYLQTLMRRSKWHSNNNPIKIGDVVLIKDETLSHSTNLPLARVSHLYYGDDGTARAADVSAKGHTYRRALSRLIPICSPKDQENSSSSN